MSTRIPAHRPALSIIPFLLLAANLRPALTSVGPLVGEIQSATGLSGTAAGFLNSLPLLAFAAFAPLAHFGRRLGIERTLVVALLLLFVGVLVRSCGSIPALFAGTLLLAAGIAVGNILVPGIVKRDYPERVKPLMTVYAVTLGLSAAIASGLAVPFAAWIPGGWQGALGVWAIPALVAALAWTPVALRNGKPMPHSRTVATIPAWRSPLAWFVTGFMGLQSLYFYVAIAWLPSIFQSNGHDPAEAGLLITVFQLVALAMSAMLPLLLGRRKDQSFAAAIASLAMAASVGGLLIFPAGAYFWMVLMGLGGGACLPLALMFISLRSADHHQTASLSMMAQSIGYLLAALGPFAFGFIHDLSGSWTIPLAGLAVLGVILALVGYEAGRDKTISAS